MKPSEFKLIIKTAVKEAIQEELKDILLEAIKSPRTPIIESSQISNKTELPTVTLAEQRKKYMEVIGETAGITTIKANSGNIFNPGSSVDTVSEGSALPAGEVDITQIMGLIKK